MKKIVLIAFVFTLCFNLIHSQNAYPLGQTPAIGDKEFTVLIATLGGQPVPSATLTRVNAAVETFNEYANTLSGGKIRVSSIISPIMTINQNPPDLGDKLALMRQAAQQNGINLNVPYLGYVVISDDLVQYGGVGSGNGTTGQIIMGGNNLWIPGIVHEMMHMFSVGHAHIREGGNEIFPGEVQAGSDPYYFMGSEGDLKNCPVNSNSCDIFATISLPHKGRFAWIDSDEYGVNNNDGNEKFFKIFNHDNTTRTTKEKLGIYLKGFYNEGVFVVSYLKVPDLDQRERLASDGVMIHYVPYVSPAISELLDLTPNSITSNPERPNDITFTNMHDAGDGAIGEGQSVDVSDLFNIEVIRENVEPGDNNHSVEFKITPLTCAIINSPFNIEDFVYTEVGNEDRCIESFSSFWNLNNDSRNIARIDNQSLEYPPLVSDGSSLKIPLDNSSAPRSPAFLMRRTLETTYNDGDTMWLGYLLKANQIRNGHIFVSPNSDISIGIGKRWGNILGIDNTSVNLRSLTNGETVFLVAKYELNQGSSSDNVYLWVNPNINEPIEQDAVTYKENINIGEIREIGINFQSVGDFNIDRIAVADSYSNLINNTLSNSDFSNQITLNPYPNPVKNVLHLSNSKLKPLEIIIYSSLGKKVMEFSNFTKDNIDLSKLSTGLFFLKVKDLNIGASKTYKLIKK